MPGRDGAPRALLLQHGAGEHAGLFAGWWAAAGLTTTTVGLHTGESLPTTLAGWDALVVLGGAQSVRRPVAGDETVTAGVAAGHTGSVSSAEVALVREALDRGLPTLGLCLGAQILAVAAGGAVGPGPVPERGVGHVTLTTAAAADPLLHTLDAGSHRVVQWHDDGITDLPPDAVVLATGDVYPVQAFRVGPRAWGFQFHAEADDGMVTAWAAEDGLDPRPHLHDLMTANVERVWRPVTQSFARLAGAP